MDKYITKQEYREWKGVDLDVELHDLDDKTNKAKRFIKQITDWCVGYLIMNYRAFELRSWNEGDPEDDVVTEYRQRLFREGVADEIEYILSNGNLLQHAGLNVDTGLITDVSKLELSRAAKLKFRQAGFCNI